MARIQNMGGAAATIELGSTLPENSAGTYLEQRHKSRLIRTDLPMGLRRTDAFMEILSELAGRDMPAKYADCRGRLVDAMVDGHKYIFGKRAVVFGEEDLVVGLCSFLSEIGIQPVLCASGGKSGRMQDAVEAVLCGSHQEKPRVVENVDFYDIEQLICSMNVDLLIGHSKGYSLARREKIPLIRVGFPIHDRVGGQRLLHLGYHGAQQLFDTITNTVIAEKQESSSVGYSYM